MASPQRTRAVSAPARLAALGLTPATALPRLQQAGLWEDDAPTEDAAELVEELAAAASPDDALRAVADLATNAPDVFARVRDEPDVRRRLIALAGGSRPLGDLVARHPAAIDALRDPYRVDAGAVAEEVRARVAEAGADVVARAAAIAEVRRRVTAAIAARDLAGELDVERVASDLAALAAGVLQGTLAAVTADAPDVPALCIVAMGKLGGRELNYVSDIDVIFVHRGDGDDSGAREAAQRACAAVLRLLNASTTMGRAYEVDPTLRPEGREGPLSRTVASFVSYWGRWARTWEFQALLKARPVAGDLELGDELLRAAEPFVFPEQLDPDAIAAVREMKGRVEAKRDVVQAGERQLKLGPGGLRDIEFAVQLLQLVHGRGDRSLRAQGTLPALAALAAGGYVADDDAATFAAAYRQLRTVEHRLQLAEERRTHTLPDDPERLERLARSLGHRATTDGPARDALLADLRSAQAQVRDLHAKLFYRPLLEAHAAVPAQDAAFGTAGLDNVAARTRLEALGFRDAAAALRDLRDMTGGLTRRATTLRAVLPAMLHALAATADPNGGLQSLRTIVEAHGDASDLLARLRDQPPVADALARVLGTSPFAGELLATQPQGVSWLTDEASRAQPRTRDELVSSALAQLGWQDDLDARLGALRRLKRRELTRIVVRDVTGDATVHQVAHELTHLGEACLEAGLRAILDARGSSDQPPRITIIGVGKFGGRELHYPSDLDVIFVHEAADGPDDARAAAAATAVAEEVLRALSSVTAEGTAFEVDAELRPEGRSGPISRSLQSCRTYYDRWSQPWEHQALLKARHVAGDAELGARFVEMAQNLAYPEAFGARDLTAMRKMKARIERERIPKRADPTRHLKLGPGGLSDIEWTVQLLQQQHGRTQAQLRTTATVEALDAAQDAMLLPARDATWLRDGYRFLSQTRNRLYLLRMRDVDTLPTGAREVERLARALGYGRASWQAYEEDHRRHTRRVRQVMERRFYGRD